MPTHATISGGASGFSEEMGEAITAAADGTPAGSPEREFAQRWTVGEDFEDSFNQELDGYYGAVTARLSTQEGYDGYVRLAESRRDRVRKMPIFESPLLFAHTNIPEGAREMRPDGTVVEV